LLCTAVATCSIELLQLFSRDLFSTERQPRTKCSSPLRVDLDAHQHRHHFLQHLTRHVTLTDHRLPHSQHLTKSHVHSAGTAADDVGVELMTMPRVTALLASQRATHATVNVNKEKVSSTHTLWPECVSTSLAICCACTTDLIHSLAACAVYNATLCTHKRHELDSYVSCLVRDLIWFWEHITQVPTVVPAPPSPFTLLHGVRRTMRHQLHAGHHLRLACFVAQPCNGSRSILGSLRRPSVKHRAGCLPVGPAATHALQ